MSGVYAQRPDGSYEPAVPLGWQGSGIDIEVYGTGPFEWFAYDEDVLVGRGSARTRLGLAWAIRRARRRWRRAT